MQTVVIRRFYYDLLFVKLQIIFVRKKIKEQKLQICNAVELLVSKSAIEINIIPKCIIDKILFVFHLHKPIIKYVMKKIQNSKM